MRISSRTVGGVVALWAVTVLVAGTVTWLAISTAGSELGQVTARQPVPTAGVTEVTGSGTPTASAAPSSSESSTGGPSGEQSPAAETAERTVDVAAGSVVASCQGDRLTLTSVRPRSGWRVEHEVEDSRGKVSFHRVSGEGEITVRLGCASGTLTSDIERDAD